jgi:hypothetical protein
MVEMVLGGLQWTCSKLWGKIIKDTMLVKAKYIYIYIALKNVLDRINMK